MSEYGVELVSFANVGAVAAIANEVGITIYDTAYMILAQKRETTVYTADETLLDNLEEGYTELASHTRAYS